MGWRSSDAISMNPIKLSRREDQALHLCGSDVAGIEAREMECGGDIALDGTFNARGPIVLVGARIDGDSYAAAAPSPDTIDARGIEVGGSVSLSDGSGSRRAIIISGARIGGDLVYRRDISERGATALNADDAEVKRHVLLGNGFMARGEVSIRRASIGGMIYGTHGVIENRRYGIGRRRDPDSRSRRVEQRLQGGG